MFVGLKMMLGAIAVAALGITCSVAEAAQPQVHLLSPGREQVLPGPDVEVRFSISNARLSPGGNSIHFMLDNEPFEVQYDPSHPHVFKDVAPGTHTIRAYLANSMHEAIRGSMHMVTFNVAYADGSNRQCPGVPTLTYNLPQGEYLGIDAGDIAIDYLLNDVALAPGGYKVAYYIDGRRYFVENGMPRHAKGLRPGYHTVRIELQDQNGDLLGGPFNSVERTILLSPDRSTPSASGLASKYPVRIPHIDSLKGAMTMGRTWTAIEPARPMTAEQVKQSQKLTVRHGTGEATGAGTVTESRRTTGLSADQTITEAPETVTEPAQTETVTRTETRTETTTDDDPAAAANRANSIRTEAKDDFKFSTSSRRLDDRLIKSPSSPVTSVLRADPPTSSGRVKVRRVPVAQTTATQTGGSASTASATVAATPTPSPVATATPAPTPTPIPTPTPAPGEVTPMPTYAPGETSPTPAPAPGEVTPMPTYEPGQTSPTPAPTPGV